MFLFCWPMESPSSFARSLSFSLLSPPARPRQGRHKRRRTRPRRPRARSRSCRRAVGPPLRPRRSPTTTSRSAKPSLGSLKCKHEKRESAGKLRRFSLVFPEAVEVVEVVVLAVVVVGVDLRRTWLGIIREEMAGEEVEGVPGFSALPPLAFSSAEGRRLLYRLCCCWGGDCCWL